MTNISFENTQIAFEYKTDKELKKATISFFHHGQNVAGKAWVQKLLHGL